MSAGVYHPHIIAILEVTGLDGRCLVLFGAYCGSEVVLAAGYIPLLAARVGQSPAEV